METLVPDRVDRVLDASGLCCPMPIVKANKAIQEASAGDVLEIIATDPGTCSDIPSWCARLGHELVGHNEKDGAFHYYVRKKAS